MNYTLFWILQSTVLTGVLIKRYRSCLNLLLMIKKITAKAPKSHFLNKTVYVTLKIHVFIVYLHFLHVSLLLLKHPSLSSTSCCFLNPLMQPQLLKQLLFIQIIKMEIHMRLVAGQDQYIIKGLWGNTWPWFSKIACSVVPLLLGKAVNNK